MPDDLLRDVIGPTPYSAVWLWIAIGLILLLCAWYGGVFVLTSRRRPVRELPVLGAARANCCADGRPARSGTSETVIGQAISPRQVPVRR